MLSRNLQAAAWSAATSLLLAASAVAAGQKQNVQASTVVTVQNSEAPGGVLQDALHLKVDGRESNVTGFTQLRGPGSKVELVVLIDDGARSSLGLQMNDVAEFILAQRPDTKVALAYMENGEAAFAGPLTSDHASALRALHLPMAGIPGISGSPYFCLSDLAKKWPSTDPRARREVVMITDGVDNYDPHYNPQDPYVQNAMDDAVRAHLIVFSIYWSNRGRFDTSNYGSMDGQNLLAMVTETTGGVSYWQGRGNPVNLAPYFEDVTHRFENQYELDFMTATGNKPEIQNIKLTASSHAKIEAPEEVYVHPGTE